MSARPKSPSSLGDQTLADDRIELLESMVRRAGQLSRELEAVYNRDLAAKSVSVEARNLTHEVIEKCSNIMDQAMSLCFERDIKPVVPNPLERGYFPTATDEQSYRSSMGKWGAADLSVIAPAVDAKIRSLQPFASPQNTIFARIRSLANKKHTSLAPQKRVESKRVNVTSPSGGGVSWGPGVTFGPGVSVMGVPIDPRTQMPAHSRGIDIKVEVWVSFEFEEGGENALVFCKSAVSAAKRVIDTLVK